MYTHSVAFRKLRLVLREFLLYKMYGHCVPHYRLGIETLTANILVLFSYWDTVALA